jgi:hypothetical protein
MAQMKPRLSQDGDTLVLLIAFGLITATSLPNMKFSNIVANGVEAFEFDESGDMIPTEFKSKKTDYISRLIAFLSCDDYAVLKTLFKIADVISDLNYLSIMDYSASPTSEKTIDEILTEFSIFLSDEKKQSLTSITSTLKFFQDFMGTMNEFSNSFGKESAAPKDVSDSEKTLPSSKKGLRFKRKSLRKEKSDVSIENLELNAFFDLFEDALDKRSS